MDRLFKRITADRALCRKAGSLRWAGAVLLLLPAAMCGYASVGDGQFKYTGGFDYSSGTYNDAERTSILYLPYGAGYKQGSFSGRIVVSWISIEGPGTVVGGGDGGVVLPSDGGETRRESGIGDTWVSLTYEIDAFPYEYGYLDVTGKLKIPTADEDKGLGTGEADLKLELDYMYPIDRLTPMVTLAYTKKGDPDGIDLRNVFYCSAGADWRHSKEISFGATLDFQQASVRGVDNPLDFFTYLSYKFSATYSLTPYLYFGLSKGSPDIGGGLQVTFRP